MGNRTSFTMSKKTLAAINADYSGNGVIGNNNGNANAPTPSMANNVIYENFYNWRRNYANGEYCTVYDFSTGYSWKLRIMTKDAHRFFQICTWLKLG